MTQVDGVLVRLLKVGDKRHKSIDFLVKVELRRLLLAARRVVRERKRHRSDLSNERFEKKRNRCTKITTTHLGSGFAQLGGPNVIRHQVFPLVQLFHQSASSSLARVISDRSSIAQRQQKCALGVAGVDEGVDGALALVGRERTHLFDAADVLLAFGLVRVGQRLRQLCVFLRRSNERTGNQTTTTRTEFETTKPMFFEVLPVRRR